MFASDALLLGRKTYEGFAKAWPTQTNDPVGYGKRMNSLPKYVVSATLKSAEWSNSTVLRGDFVKEIMNLKQQLGKDILVFGSGKHVEFLMNSDLLDELRLVVIL